MDATKQSGFSLLELIASLAIVSLVSAALFQSTASWMRLSARASAASNESLSSVASQQIFHHLVNGLTYAWPEDRKNVFSGNSNGFRGLTRTPLDGLLPRLSPVEITLKAPTAQAPGEIVYRSDEAIWTLQEFDQSAAISYLGADARWYSSWPPSDTPEPGPFNDAQFLQTPQLPAAIRIEFFKNDKRRVWIADIASDPRIPQRLQDLQ